MQLAKMAGPGGESAAILTADSALPLRLGGEYATLADVLAAPDPAAVARDLCGGAESMPLDSVQLLAPIDQQEVWAAGVTYRRSKRARMEESEGGGDFYDRVYDAERPELFLKATPSRVVGPGGALRIRRDSEWNVPEPELTLVLSPSMRLVGYTIGNDMSSRDIEGANPLYLPQAKVYGRLLRARPLHHARRGDCRRLIKCRSNWSSAAADRSLFPAPSAPIRFTARWRT